VEIQKQQKVTVEKNSNQRGKQPEERGKQSKIKLSKKFRREYNKRKLN
jgi:hypothetical protein